MIHRAAFRRNFAGEVEEKEYIENIRRKPYAKPIAIKKGEPVFRLSSTAMLGAFEEFRSLNGPSKPKAPNTSETDSFLTERAALRKVKPNLNPRFSTQVFLDNDQDSDNLTPIQRSFLGSIQSHNSDGQNKLQIPGKIGNRNAPNPQGGPRPQTNQDQSRSSSTNNPKLNEIARNYGKGGLESIKESHESAASSPNAKEPNNSGNQTAQNRGQQGAAGGAIGKGPAQTSLNASLEPRQNAAVPHKDVRLKAEPEHSNSEQLQSGHPGSDDSSQNFLTGTVGVHNSPIKTRNQTTEQQGVRPIVGDSKQEEKRSTVASFGPQGELAGAAKNAGERPNPGNQQATDASQAQSTQPAPNSIVAGTASTLQQPQAPAISDSSRNEAAALKQTEAPATAAEAKTGFFSMNMSGTAAPNNSIKGLFASSQPSAFFATKQSDTVPATNPAAVSQQETPAQPAAQPTAAASVVPAPTIAPEVNNEVKAPAATTGTSFFGGNVPTGLFSGSGLSGPQQTQTNGASTSGTASGAGFAKPQSPPKQSNNPFLQPLGPSTTGESILNNILQKSKDSGMFGPSSGTFGGSSNRDNSTTAAGFFTGGTSSAGQSTGSSFFNRDSAQAQGGGSFFNNLSNREQPVNNCSSGAGGGSSFFSGQSNNNNRSSGNVAGSFFGGGSGGENRGSSSSNFFGSGGNNSSAFQSRVDEERPGPSGGHQSQAASNFFSGSSSGQNRPSAPAGNAFFGSSSGGGNSFFGSTAPSIFQQASNNGGRAPEYNQHGQQIRRISQKPNQEKFW